MRGEIIMEYSINKQELQKISYQFRTLSSRLLRTDFTSAIDNLKRLLNYIDTTPLIKKFINDNNVVDFDIPNEIEKKNKSRYGRFDIPINISEEISFVYQLLSYAAENHRDYYTLSSSYSFATKYQDHADEFNKIVVIPFINHITSYFEGIMIDSGMFENSSNVFQFNGPNMGQINVSKDSSTLNATMTVNPSVSEIGSIVSQILATIQQEEIPNRNREDIVNAVEAINEQVQSTTPKKNYLKIFIDTVKGAIAGVAVSTTFLETMNGFIEKAQAFMDMLP